MEVWQAQSWVKFSKCWLTRPTNSLNKNRESLKPTITRYNQQHKDDTIPCAQATPTVGWSRPSPPRFALQPGQNNLLLRIHRLRRCCVATVSDIHGSIEPAWRSLVQSFWPMGLWPFCASHRNPGSCLKQTNSSGLPNSFHHASLQHTRCTASFSLHSTIWINWMPAAAIQKANAETNSDHHHAPWGA